MKDALFEIRDGILERYTGEESEVVIPEGVRVIGERAFRECRSIRRVELGSGLEEIRTEAFQWCTRLESVTGGAAVKSVGRDAFAETPWYRYYSENEVQWKDDFIFLGRCLVKARRNIRRADIPEGTLMIAADAFSERVMLKNVTIPESVTYIGWRAFENCSGITRITIPGSVKTLGWHCFKGCSRLAVIEFEEGVEVLENGIFSGCRGMHRITFPASLRELGGWMFFNCMNLEVVRFKGAVSEIKERTFSGCAGLVYTDFPQGLKRIGVEAFYECINLERAILPEGLTSIARQAFTKCRCLSELVLPASLTELGEGVFQGCLRLKEIAVPGGIDILPENAFNTCTELAAISIGEGVKEIGRACFSRCRKLRDVTLPQSLEILGDEAFAGCDGLVSIRTGDGGNKRGTAFAPLGSYSLRRIGKACFARCSALRDIELPGPDTEIGGLAFSGCVALADDYGYIIRGGVFYAYIGDSTEVSVPESCDAVASGAFAENPAYRKITLPACIRAVGAGAFRGCARLESIEVMSHDITEIGSEPFAGCDRLVALTACGMTPEAYDDENIRTAAALGYCTHCDDFPQSAVESYSEYVRVNMAQLIRRAVDCQLAGAVKYFTDKDELGRDDFNEVLEYAQQKKAQEITALLLEYRSRHVDIDAFDKYVL